jgi:hypothetical protein
MKGSAFHPRGRVFCFTLFAMLILTLVLSILVPPLAVEAQRPPEVRRIGYLQADISGLPGAYYELLREGLRDLGYVEGHNLVIAYRSADDRARLAELAAELVRLNVEVIVAPGGWRLPPPREPQRRCRSCSRSAATRSRPVSSRALAAPAGT